MPEPAAASTLPTLVLVPGMDGSGRLFAPLVRALDGFDVRIASYATRLDDEERELARTVPAHASYVLVAESFGGPIAMRFAATRPRGLVGLVLVATFVEPPLPSSLGRALGALPHALFDRAPPGFAVRLAMTGLRADTALVDEVRATLDGSASGVLASRVRRIASIDVREAASAIDVPVLVLSARHDRMLPRSCVRALHAAFSGRAPRARFVTVDGPHLLLQAEPDACARLIRDFLASL